MKTLLSLVMVVCLLGGAIAAVAEPSPDEIYRVAKAGDMQKANTMIDEVITAHPKSAKAHFIKAQLDAAQGRVNEARSELAVAETLPTEKPFASPQAISHLKEELNQLSTGNGFNHTAKRVKAEGSGSGWMTWLVLIVIGLVIFAIIRSLMRPKFQPVANGGQGYGAQGYGSQGYGGGQPYGGPGYPQGGGMGSGIMGGLATGAAIGAGVVAGEVLMHKMLDDDHSTPVAHQNPEGVQQNGDWEEPQVADSAYDMGGDNFGASDGGWDSGGGGGGDDWS